MTPELLEILASWRSLNAGIGHLTEDDLRVMLKYEARNERRMMVLERMHQRYNKLRSKREWKELMEKVQ